MFDLLIRGATLPDGRRNQDVAVRDGRIVDVAHGIEGQAGEVIEAEGHLLSPPFVDPHFHMDATLSLGQPRMNVSGTLLEGIALWGELRPTLTRDAVVERALRYCDLAVSKGLLAVRSHVDVSDPRLVTVEGLLEVRERVAPYLDLQLVAFPQDGYHRGPEAADALSRALDMGVDVVGASRISNARWRTAVRRSRRSAASPPNGACASTCTATRRTTPCRAMSRRLQPRRCASDFKAE